MDDKKIEVGTIVVMKKGHPCGENLWEIVKKLILERVDYMYGRKEPNVEMYYDSLPEIIKDLEETDFTTGKWGQLL